MPPIARVGDPTGHPGVIGPPGVPTVLIGGLPPPTLGPPHGCPLPAPRGPPADDDRAPREPDSADRRHAGGPCRRHGGLRSTDRHGRADRPGRVIAVQNDFIGAGWAFPVTTDATGGIALAVREREIEQAIRLILQT